MKDSDLMINEVISFIKDDNLDLDFEFIYWLVFGVKDYEFVLDEIISFYLKDWIIVCLLKMDCIILRMVIYEILYSDIFVKVVMNEVVELIK